MPTITVLISLAAVAVIAWYFAEWRNCAERGEPMDLLRNPLALFGLTLTRIWRNRSLVIILLALWVASWALNAFVIWPLVHKPYLERMGYSGEGLKEPRTDKRSRVVPPGEIVRWTLDALPRTPTVAIADWPISIPVLGVFACALIYLWRRRPQWLPESAVRAIAWPALLAVAGFLFAAELAMLGYGSMLRGDPSSPESSYVWPTLLHGLVAPFLAGALTALLWHAVYQAGNGGRWSLRRATVAAVRTWLPVAWLVFAIYLPLGIATVVPVPLGADGLVSSPIGWALFDARQYLFSLTGYLSIAFVFVPWVIFERRYSFRAAVVENFRMMGRHWRDLLAFLPRYIILAAPLYGLLSYVADTSRYALSPYAIAAFALYLLQVVLMFAVVVVYTELRKSEQPVAEPSHPESTSPVEAT